MAETANTLITEIRFELKDIEALNYTDTELLVYLSDALEDLVQHISATWPYYWHRTTQTKLDIQNIVSGTADYALPASCYKVVVVSTKDAAGTTELIEPLTFSRTFDSAADGYYVFNDRLYIYPTPTANVANGLNIHYITQPTRLALVSDTVQLSEDFRGLMKEYVVIKCKARHEENPEAFIALYKKLESQLNAMVTETNKGADVSWKIPRRRWW